MTGVDGDAVDPSSVAQAAASEQYRLSVKWDRFAGLRQRDVTLELIKELVGLLAFDESAVEHVLGIFLRFAEPEDVLVRLLVL